MKKEDKRLIGVENVDIFATTSARRLKLFRDHCTVLCCHHVMCSCLQYAGYDYVCYPAYLGLYKILKMN